MNLFLDPRQPLSTCSAATCRECPLQSRVTCHFGGKDLVRFMVIALPPFVVAGIGISRLNGSKILRCWANYGAPKLWRYRPGPMGAGEKVTFFGGVALIGGYPLAVLIISGQWLWLLLFTSVVAGMGVFMAQAMCARCMTFACPFNRVEKGVRAAFLACNPLVASAWEREHTA